jgi:hypothetical protein
MAPRNMNQLTRITCAIIASIATLACGDRPPADWAEFAQQIPRLHAEDKTAEVVNICERFVRDHPTFPDARYNLAVALHLIADDMKAQPSLASVRKQNLEAAAAHYERYHELAALEHRARVSSGLTRIYAADALNQPPKAEASARSWIEEAPRDFIAYETLARLLREGGRHDAATGIVRQARDVMFAAGGNQQDRAIDRGGWANLAVDHLEGSPDLSPADTRALLDDVLEVADDILKWEPKYVSALQYKAAGLKIQATRLEPDAIRRRALLAEADGLDAQAASIMMGK